jgi:hypothetical protein
VQVRGFQTISTFPLNRLTEISPEFIKFRNDISDPKIDRSSPSVQKDLVSRLSNLIALINSRLSFASLREDCSRVSCKKSSQITLTGGSGQSSYFAGDDSFEKSSLLPSTHNG